jgi:drug/metabolite transporter (DMT)-like permease
MLDPHPGRANLSRGYAIAVAAAVFLSTTAIFIRYLTVNFQIPPLVLALWRDIFVALTLLPVFWVFYPRLLSLHRREVPYLIFYGFVLAVFNSMWTVSVSLNGAAIATVLVYCSAAFTAILGWWLLKESLGWVKLLAVVFSLAGCVLVSGSLNNAGLNMNLTGILTGILSGLCYAAYSLLGRSASQRGLNPWTTLFYTFGIAAFFLAVVNLIPGGFIPGAAVRTGDLLWLGKSIPGWGILFALAAGPTIAGFGLYNISLSYLPSSVANLIVTLEPAFTTVTAFFILGETLTGPQVGGSVMILAGVVFLRVFEGLRDHPPRPSSA